MDGDLNVDNRTEINEPIKEFFISNHEYHPLQAMYNALGCCDATERKNRYVYNVLSTHNVKKMCMCVCLRKFYRHIP